MNPATRPLSLTASAPLPNPPGNGIVPAAPSTTNHPVRPLVPAVLALLLMAAMPACWIGGGWTICPELLSYSNEKPPRVTNATMPSLLIETGVPLMPIAAPRSTSWSRRAGSAAAAAEIAATSATMRAQPAMRVFEDHPSRIEWKFISTPSRDVLRSCAAPQGLGRSCPRSQQSLLATCGERTSGDFCDL